MLLTSGVYEHDSAMQLTGTVTLDAQGDPGAVFVFKAGSSLVTASNSRVALINGASPCHVFWQVGSSATLGTSTDFVGTVLALTSATLGTGADVEGRIFARNGAVTLDTNDITVPTCAGVPPPPPPTTPAPSPTGSPTGSPTTAPTGSPTSPTGAPTGVPTTAPSGTPTDNQVGLGSPAVPGEGTGTPDDEPSEPTIPIGHPETGAVPAGAPDRGSMTLFGLAAIAGGGAVLASIRARRLPRRH